MHQMIFVNLPVRDVAASRRFFTDLGYTVNEAFCEEGSTLCLQMGDTIYAMLLSHARFADFTDKPILEPGQATEVLLCLSASSREAVDSLVDQAVASGGTDLRTEDHGFMYGRSYADLDGHIWEIMWMDPAAAQG